MTSIVDRIGAGDAFAAGVLHGLATGADDATSLRLGFASACLKHSVPGDVGLASRADLDAFVGERRFDVRR
jgi:2-dehydro-3-deoxygluconokinase